MHTERRSPRVLKWRITGRRPVIAAVIPLRNHKGDDVPRYGIKILLLWVFVAACLMTFAVYRNQLAYFSISILLPCVIGLFSRYGTAMSNHKAMLAILGSSLVTGVVLMAYGSYFRTYIQPSQGCLIGDGWNSVLASAVFGGVVGSICGLFALFLYFIVTSIVDVATPNQVL